MTLLFSDDGEMKVSWIDTTYIKKLEQVVFDDELNVKREEMGRPKDVVYSLNILCRW